MSKMTDRRVVIVTRPTRLDNILAKESTIQQARFKMASQNMISQSFSKADETNTDFALYETEHNSYQAAIQAVKEHTGTLAPVQVLERRYLPNFLFHESDIVICIGQDGLVANTLKYLDGQPVVGINPDRKAYDGILLPFEPKDALRIIRDVSQDKRKYRSVSMGEVRFPDGQRLLAVNDFFIGQRGHASARYIIKYKGLKEPQSSSGVIVSTGMGSTGWLKSVITGAKGVSSSVIGEVYKTPDMAEALLDYDEDGLIAAPAMKMACVEESEVCIDEKTAFSRVMEARKDAQVLQKQAARVPKKARKVMGASELDRVVGQWESRDLIFAVREPFPSKTSGTGIIFGRIAPDETLRIESMMGENGIIFSDGIESDYLDFNSGMEATITIAAKTGRVIV